MVTEQLTRRLTDEEVAVEMGQYRVLNRVSAENRRQLMKWGVQDHEPSFWYLVLMEEMGELAAAILAESAGEIPATQRAILYSAHNIGCGAQMALEGGLPDRINVGGGAVSDGHTSSEEAIQVAAVAVAMEAARARRGEKGA
jgi:hypothetical protein